jgi:PLP dependent protein
VNSVDTAKKVDGLEKGRRQWLESTEQTSSSSTSYESPRLRVFVQVNTSGEESKSGVEPGDAAIELCRHVHAQPSLILQGLMTIGAIARSQASAETENEDFVILKRERDHVAEALQINAEELELSMGMSQDYEAAIKMGSREVRVGSIIFGERPPKSEATV